MRTKLKWIDGVALFVGLIGAVLLWLKLDPNGIGLYLGFGVFGVSRIHEFFRLNRYEQFNLKELLKLLKLFTCVLMIVIAASHMLAGNKPMLGTLLLVVLLWAFTALEPKQDISESEI